MMKTLFAALSLVLSLSGECRCKPAAVFDFYTERDQIFAAEDAMFLGADRVLNGNEILANDVIMTHKVRELDAAFNESIYPPAKSFFNSKEEIDSSPLFDIVKSMPKGAALHLHDVAITSIDWVIQNISYNDSLYMCNDTVLHFIWSSEDPSPSKCLTSNWVNVNQERNRIGANSVDDFIRANLILHANKPYEAFPTINSVWIAFENRLSALTSLVNYEPAFYAYVRRALEEFHQDNIQRIEIRTVLPNGVCRSLHPNCQPLNEVEVGGVFKAAADDFMADHPGDTCGVAIIYAPYRGVERATVQYYMDTMNDLMTAYPGFFVGFDLVGQEDLGRPLIDFADILINASLANPAMNFYFHAGETDWQGSSTDINIIDALLMGTKRVGHGYAIAKHPEAKRLALENNVPIEVCPISNQVLGLVNDLRNHPASPLIQEGFPLILSSDDPATWDALPLSHDYYELFMGLASKSMDLRLLKELVFSSIDYSSLNILQIDQCKNLLQSKWGSFIESTAFPQNPFIELHV